MAKKCNASDEDGEEAFFSFERKRGELVMSSKRMKGNLFPRHEHREKLTRE
jgi:hypothetical protein